MSAPLMGRVFNTTLPTRAHKSVLLALANHADEESVCWPSIRLIANEAQFSERHVRRIMTDLKRLGLLEVIERQTYHRTPRYRVRGDKLSPLTTTREDIHNLKGGTSATSRGDTHVRQGGTPMSPKPSLEPSEEPPVEPSGGFAPRLDDPDYHEKRYERGKRRASETDPSLESDDGPLVRCAVEQLHPSITERHPRDGHTP